MRVVAVTALSKRFGEVRAVDDLTFEVGQGEIVGLLGANGAGKTTTMRMVLGLLAPTSGRALIEGEPVGRVDRRRLGYVPQGLGLYRELTVAENLRFSAEAFGTAPPDLAAEGLSEYANRKVGELPRGVTRRVAFVAARLHDPGVLILDEPTSGVGPLGRARLWESIHLVAETGTAVLVSTHHMEEAEECDRVVLMAQGRRVATGNVSEVISGLRTVAVVAGVTTARLDEIRRLGGTVLLSNDGWRVVGLPLSVVSEVVGSGTEVPATFEEAFVALSA
ncbi:MAG TPA: ABC transporter ATP-binding protein [Acidimicrobiia bacterium]|jgi:ABC-2 type transport system ATP-binding protein/ribosome-dependent ATPase|nr:ABC transporter ATP-binding protein [Acidimicrobiia bacterium]